MARRSTRLSSEERAFLEAERQLLGGWRALARKYGRDDRALRDWVKEDGPRGVDHGPRGNAFRERLALEMAKRRAAPGADPGDPDAEVAALLDAGKRLHFDDVRPVEAFATLQRVVFHPFAMEVPPPLLLGRMIEVLGVYRQVQHASVADFIAVAKRCLARLDRLAPGGAADERDDLAALACAVAWELAAAAAQRGQEALCIEVLDRIDGIFRGRRHWRDRPGVRPTSMTKMLQLAKVVSFPDVGTARALAKSGRNPIALLRVDPRRPAESAGIASQLMMQKTRFGLHYQGKARDEAVEFFHGAFATVFDGIRTAAAAGPGALARLATPSTAIAVAVQGIIVAGIKGEGAGGRTMRDARDLLVAVDAMGGGEVLLQRLNDQTMNYLWPARGSPPIPEVAKLEFVDPF